MAQDLRQHMALLEQAIAAAFVNDGLPVHLLGGTQGPHTLTFALRLYQPTKANLAKALKLAGVLEAAIGDRGMTNIRAASRKVNIMSGACGHLLPHARSFLSARWPTARF